MMTIDPLNDYPGYQLRRASSAAMATLAKRLGALSLRPTEATVLMVIEANPNITQSEIGRLLDIASANMAALVSRLEERDLVGRTPVDGRSDGLGLRAAGRTVTARVKKVLAAHEQTLLSKVPASCRTAFLAGLRAIWEES
jgi:DNA-binding MarR family transcriptional regulator